MKNFYIYISLMLLLVTFELKPLYAESVKIQLKSIQIIPESYQMEVGETFDFQVMAFDQDNMVVQGSVTYRVGVGFVRLNASPRFYVVPSSSKAIQVIDSPSKLSWTFSVKGIEVGNSTVKAEFGKLTAITKIKVISPNTKAKEIDKDKYPLHSAVFNKNKLNIRDAFNKGYNMDLKNEDGYTPLFIAASLGYLEGVEMLIDYGANVNLKDNDGYTALGIARKRKKDNVYNFILDYICSDKESKEKILMRKIKLDSGSIIQNFVDCPDKAGLK